MIVRSVLANPRQVKQKDQKNERVSCYTEKLFNLKDRPKFQKLLPLLRIPYMGHLIVEGFWEMLGCDIDDVSIKATTNEKMGFVGREDGVAAYAVVLIKE